MTGKKPTLCIVAGPNGSGKTTTTIQLLNNEWAADSLYINPDNIAQETFGDWNSPEAVLKAAEEATRLRYECLELGRDFVFETVFSAPEKLEFLRKAKDAGFFIRLFYVCTSDPAINVACNHSSLTTDCKGTKSFYEFQTKWQKCFVGRRPYI